MPTLRILHALILLTMRLLLASRNLLLIGSFLLLPVGVDWVITAFAKQPGPPQKLFVDTVFYFYFYFFLPLLALLYASSALLEDIEQGTFSYWLSGPAPKWTVALGKYLGTCFLVQGIMTMGILGCGLACLPLNTDGAIWPTWLHTWWIAMAGTAVYVALFQMLSFLTRRVFVAGMVYFIVVEALLSNIPTVMQKCSIMFYLRSLLHASDKWVQVQFSDYFISQTAATTGQALGVMAIYIVVSLAVSLLAMYCREFQWPKEGTP